MKKKKNILANAKQILVVLTAVLLGLGLGYLLFHQDNGMETAATTAEQSPTQSIWICSMHPQIRAEEPGLCPICEMDLIPEETGNSSKDPLVLEMSEDAMKLANIQTTLVGEGGRDGKELVLNGKIQQDERRAASQVSHFPGRIEQLYVTFTGENVKRGQRLATLYSSEMITAQREYLEALQLRDINPKLVDAARKKMLYWKISDVMIQRLETTGTIIELVDIFADSDGVVVKKRVSVGDYIKEGEALFDVVSLDKIWVLFDAYEEDLAEIRLGDVVKFTTPSVPNKTFSTKISYIDPLINPATRTLALRAEYNNQNGRLKPEMFVEGRLKTRKKSSKNVLSVPKTAVMWTGKRSVVYVKLQELEIPSFEFREVILGDMLGDRYVIESGLEEGEEVVTNGTFSLDAAAQLNNQMSMMNRLVNEKNKKEEETLIPDFRSSVSNTHKKEIGALIDAYLSLKDAFVMSDKKATKKAVVAFSKRLEHVSVPKEENAEKFWKKQRRALENHSQKLEKAEDLEDQRMQFGHMSVLLIKTVKAFGREDEMLYLQYCPMAFDDKGAAWLSREENIRNPYFGNKMMRCGVIKETF